jgi:hypothetical protein
MPFLYLIIILVSQSTEVVCTIITDVPQVFHLALVAALNPFHLLGTVVLDSMHLVYTNATKLNKLEAPLSVILIETDVLTLENRIHFLNTLRL